MKNLFIIFIFILVLLPLLANAENRLPPSKDFADGTDRDISFYMWDHKDYQGTNVSSESKAQEIFDQLNGTDHKKGFLRKGAQCFQRAHYWAYEMTREQAGLHSYKIFLFYTQRYRGTYREKWWFHVAPVILVNNVPMVMDYLFEEHPLPIKKWTDDFIDSKTPCKVMHSLSDYNYDTHDAVNGDSSLMCIIRIVPMYYYQPWDLDAFDQHGTTVNDFRPNELDMARHGFAHPTW